MKKILIASLCLLTAGLQAAWPFQSDSAQPSWTTRKEQRVGRTRRTYQNKREATQRQQNTFKEQMNRREQRRVERQQRRETAQQNRTNRRSLRSYYR